MRHGANLRFFNLSQELLSKGHEVYFTTNRKASDDRVEKSRYLNSLIDQRVISGHLETAYAAPTDIRRLFKLSLYPALVNRFLEEFQEPTKKLVEGFMSEHKIDLCVFTNRMLLFLVPAINQARPVLIDWIDSATLFLLREIALRLKRGQLAGIPCMFRWLVEACIEESYYSRRCGLNLTVSPTDKKCLDFLNHRPQRNKVLLNGVRLRPTGLEVTPIKNRLIFSGNMSFPPNYEAAVWFIDSVLPLLLEKKPDLVLVVAGANPAPQLLARRSPNVLVTGFVEELELEIARSELCVAPLVSGSGFKNKVLEAVAVNRFVVATSRGVEFLDEKIRSCLLVADTPQGMAAHILSYLDNPSRYAAQLAEVRRLVSEEFTWAKRAEELAGLVWRRGALGPAASAVSEGRAPGHGYSAG